MATYINTLQHTATHYNTLQHTTTHSATHCTARMQGTRCRAFLCSWVCVLNHLSDVLTSLQHTATHTAHYNVLQRTATHSLCVKKDLTLCVCEKGTYLGVCEKRPICMSLWRQKRPICMSLWRQKRPICMSLWREKRPTSLVACSWYSINSEVWVSAKRNLCLCLFLMKRDPQILSRVPGTPSN